MPFKRLKPQTPEVNKFTLTVGASGNTTYILDRSYPAGVYTVTFQNGDNTFDIYAIGADGTNVGYTNSGTLTATDKIKEVVVLGAANNEEIIFDNVQAGDVIIPTSKGDVASAGAFVTSVDPSSLPSIDDSVTVTGGNFAADVEAYFIDQSANEVAAKTVVRNSSTEIVVTRPDSFSTADSPFTIKVVNPNVTLPTGSSAHLLSNAVTAGTNPVWQTAAAQFYSLGIANTITLVASDTEASDVDYVITAGSLPSGLTLDGETGVITGTPSGGADGDQTVFTVRATDDGGNFVDREFTFTANAAPTWTTTSSDIGEAGVFALDEAVSFQFVANGGTGGGLLTYSVQSGSLPTGTSLDSAGLLTGTPTVEQTVTFTLRVADEAGLFADGEFTVSVALSSLENIPSSYGQLILNGYGFEAWNDLNSDNASETFTFTVPNGVSKIRAIVIGGGGGSDGDRNIISGGGGAGAEGFINVSPGSTLTCQVGYGGVGKQNSTAGSGGKSSISINGTIEIEAEGGFSSLYSEGARANFTFGPNATRISNAKGGAVSNNDSSSSLLDPSNVQTFLQGSTAHAGGAGGWTSHSSQYGQGIGFGGGGGAGRIEDVRSGGFYGYPGGHANYSGSAPTSARGGGPVGGWPNEFEDINASSGGGGGSFGGAGVDGFSGGQGAGGLVRIWWADSSGDLSWIDQGSNYIE